jgi:hypothetical protein
MRTAPTPMPNELGLCDCCFFPFDGDKVWSNGGYAHARCAAEHERLVAGEDSMPGRGEHLAHVTVLAAFLGRLGKEAAALGIDRQRLAQAIGRAADGAR